ncbi:MAG TPA: hypothetical protein VE978_05355 [Chitinophagales bacterium]|nr:hypothetical protein [Chitinophagales bacterium]
MTPFSRTNIFRFCSATSFSIIIFLSFHPNALSAPKNWTGNVNSDWNSASNWSGGTLPISTSTIIIDPSNYTGAQASPVISSNSIFTVNSLSVNNGAILTIQANLTSSSTIAINPFGSNIATRLIMTAGTLTGGSDFIIDNNGTCNFSGGIMVVGDATQCDHGGILNISGAASLTTYTLKCLRVGIASSLINMTGGTLVATSSGPPSLLLDGGNTPGSAPKFTISGGNVTLEGVTQFNTSSINDSPVLENTGGKLICKGNVRNYNGAKMTINISGGTTYFQGALMMHLSTDIITQTGGAIQFDNEHTWLNTGIYNATGGTAIFNGITTLNMSGTGIWNFYNLTIDSGQRLRQNNATNINVAGNWTDNAGIYSPNINQVTFNGSITQNISGETFNKIEFNQSGNSVLSGNVEVIYSVTFTSGIVTSTIANLLTLRDGAISTSGSAVSFVNGPMLKIGNDPFIFPVGDGTTWARVAISAPALMTDKFSAQYFHTGYGNYTIVQIPNFFHHVSEVEYWTVDRVEGTSDVKVSLFWEHPLVSAIGNCSDLRMAHWNGIAWENNNDLVTTTSAGCPNPSTESGSISSDAVVTSFSDFSFASKTGGNALPIELTSFTASPFNNTVMLAWTTATELNNNYFTVEHSYDGLVFSLVGNLVPAAGTSPLQHAYEMTDELPFSGSSYYRLKQTDFDGKDVYSNLVTVDINSPGNSSIDVFPNPVNGTEINISINGLANKHARVVIQNGIGQIFYSQAVLPDNDNYKLVVSRNKNLAPDVYFLLISSDEKFYSKKIIVN